MNVIFDLDGTLALIDHRRHFVEHPAKDWDAFYKACVDDKPNIPIVQLIIDLYWHRGYYIEIWSGRSDIVKQETVEWLEKYFIRYHALVMRKEGDYTPDEKLKEKWIDERFTEYRKIRPTLAFDDRDKVVAMWRRRGITCCQVAEGDF